MLEFGSFLRAVNDRPYEWMTMGCLEFDGDCHGSTDHWLAMTGDSGVGISPVIETAFLQKAEIPLFPPCFLHYTIPI